MTPVEYEKLIEKILNAEIDIEDLRERVDEERMRRIADERETKIKEARCKLLDAITEYMSIVINDEKVTEWLRSPEARLDFTKGFKEIEDVFTKANPFDEPTTKEKEIKNIEDNVREWLNEKNKKKIHFQF